MPDVGKSGAVRDSVATSSGRRQDLYQRYAAALYQQALLALGDQARAAQVVCDVLIEEGTRAPGPERGDDDARFRLAESVFRSCDQLNAGRLVGEYERGALGLVLYGGLGYIRASGVLGIDPRDMAALLRTALRRLGTPAD